ncbi:DUF1679 domain containing protein [Trichuris trichiura]|uniref:DUF1679 domain containing protein n=1 Tax=Trichuris trichiura TaxID=36087 RepID=A0A077Z150_TRITR|nr:DUF1679 domain containing protein [Trichuris trichiura]
MDNSLLNTYPDLKEKLQSSINEIHDTEYSLKETELEEIQQSSPKAKITVQVQLIWDDDGSDDEKLPKKLILQVPRLHGQSDSPDDHAKECNVKDYNSEVEFYAFFKDHPEIAFPLPCCYAAETEGEEHGILVLEDLSDHGVFIDDISAGMTTGQLLNVTAALANLHSWCLKNSSYWQEKFNSSKAGLIQLRDTMEVGLKNMKSQYPDRCAQVDFDLIMEKYTEENISQWSDKISKSIPEVLTRHQLWINSLLFRKRSDGTPGDDLVAIVNWENVGRGSLLEDICSLLSWCTTPEMRRKYERIVLVYYRKKLEQGVDGDVQLPDNDSLWKAYKQTFWLRGLMLLGMIPTLLQTTALNESEDEEEKKTIMLERAIACYEDSIAFFDENDD